MSRAITDIVASFCRYIDATVKISSNVSNSSSELTVITFSTISLAILAIKFYLAVIEENSKRRSLDRLDGVLRPLRFLGLPLLIVPLIVCASAIPRIFYEITPNAFIATSSLAKRVAAIGDGLLAKVDDIHSLHIAHSLDEASNIAKLADTEVRLIDQNKSDLNQAKLNYRVISKTVKDLNEAKRLHSGQIGVTSNIGWGPKDDRKLASAEQQRQEAKAALDTVSNAASGISQAIGNKAKNAKNIAELERAKNLEKALDNDANSLGVKDTAEQGSLGIASIMNIGALLKSLGTIINFLLNIALYLCILPAFIGLIAGALVFLKEALSLLQYGAKLEIIKNLTLGIASIFAPIFMLCFLFAKTEQFAWKYITLMFSIYFGFFALSYVCAVFIGPGLNGFGNIMGQLTTISASTREASMELFIESVVIGLKGVGVGMIAAFSLSVVKSAITVGQSLISGNFSVSS